jgi:cell wall-associated NlpC family hydrolase
VATISSQIAQQQAALDQADELYNEAQVNLTSTRAALQATSATVAASKARLAAERAKLRTDAIQSYVGDTSSSATAALFAAPTTGAQIRSFYSDLGAANVAQDVARGQAPTKALDTTRAKLLSEQKAETAQLAAQDTARQSASAAAATSEATLTSVQGTLATEVAQQAAAQAAQAAQAAANASTPAASQAAADQAAQDSSVASAVASGTAAATAAAGSASQAATTVITTNPVTGGSGSGSSGSSGSSSSGSGSGSGSGSSGVVQTAVASGITTAAGLAAVHGAMNYLGVPYVWGGASSAGLDCSGLTMLAWASAGVSLPHSAALQYQDFPHVSLNALQPGDLLFYDLDGSGIDHVVMYVGPTLDGSATAYGSQTIIQAAHTGTVVTFDPLWYFGLVGAARP